jgi:hypothetical protein
MIVIETQESDDEDRFTVKQCDHQGEKGGGSCSLEHHPDVREYLKDKAIRRGEDLESDKAWKILGLNKLNADKLRVHWFVGQVWLNQDKQVVLRVTPKVPQVSAFQMYLACLVLLC